MMDFAEIVTQSCVLHVFLIASSNWFLSNIFNNVTKLIHLDYSEEANDVVFNKQKSPGIINNQV